jgi:hypothetical protein
VYAVGKMWDCYVAKRRILIYTVKKFIKSTNSDVVTPSSKSYFEFIIKCKLYYFEAIKSFTKFVVTFAESYRKCKNKQIKLVNKFFFRGYAGLGY